MCVGPIKSTSCIFSRQLCTDIRDFTDECAVSGHVLNSYHGKGQSMYAVVRQFSPRKEHKYALLAPENGVWHSQRRSHRARSSIMLATLLALFTAASVVTAWPRSHAWGHPPCNTIDAGYQCRPDLSHYWGKPPSSKNRQAGADYFTKVNIRHTLKSSLKFQTCCRSNVISPLPRYCLATEPVTQHVSLH